MASFTPTQKTALDFNGGVEYENGDGVQPQTINNLIESQLYTQELVNNSPNGLSIRLTISQLNTLATVGLTTTTPLTNIANPDAIKIGDTVIDKYKSNIAFYLSFWSVTNVSGGTVYLSAIGYEDIVTIVQELGNSQFDIMSQNAVTNAINSVSARVSRNAKKISNIESLLLKDTFVTDSEVAYTKDVPQNSAPFALISKIGGLTYKVGGSENYFNFNQTYNQGQTQIVANGNTLAISGISSYQGNAYTEITLGSVTLPKGYYNFGVTLNNTVDKMMITEIYSDSISVYIQVAEGTLSASTSFEIATDTVVTIKIAIYDNGVNSSVNATYNLSTIEKLVDAKVTEVKSVGRNLHNPATDTLGYYKSGNSIYPVSNGFYTDFVRVKPSTRYTYSGIISYTNFYDINKNVIDKVYDKAQVTTPANCYYMVWSGFSATPENWQVCEGSEAPTDLTYTEHTLTIPEAVQSLEGYGLGIDNTYYNYIDFENKKFNRIVGVVDLGTLNWELGSVFYASIGDKKGSYNLIADNYDTFVGSVANLPDKSLTINTECGDLLYIKDSTYADAATFKSAMSGVMLVYELATPTTEDIPEIDNLIGVEGGGTLTFENEGKNEVPNEIIYQIGGQ